MKSVIGRAERYDGTTLGYFVKGEPERMYSVAEVDYALYDGAMKLEEDLFTIGVGPFAMERAENDVGITAICVRIREFARDGQVQFSGIDENSSRNKNLLTYLNYVQKPVQDFVKMYLRYLQPYQISARVEDTTVKCVVAELYELRVDVRATGLEVSFVEQQAEKQLRVPTASVVNIIPTEVLAHVPDTNLYRVKLDAWVGFVHSTIEVTCTHKGSQFVVNYGEMTDKVYNKLYDTYLEDFETLDVVAARKVTELIKKAKVCLSSFALEKAVDAYSRLKLLDTYTCTRVGYDVATLLLRRICEWELSVDEIRRLVYVLRDVCDNAGQRHILAIFEDSCYTNDGAVIEDVPENLKEAYYAIPLALRVAWNGPIEDLISVYREGFIWQR